MSEEEINFFKRKGATNVTNQSIAMATLSTNTVTVPSTSYLVHPISSSTTLPAQQYQGPTMDPLSQFDDIVTLRRRKSRMLPNPKKTHSIEIKIFELREEFFKGYLTGADTDKHGFCNQLISQDAPINTKYKELDLEALLKKNMVKGRLTNLIQALGILEKYASNLIKPNKPQFWRTLKFTSSLMKTYLENMKGSIDILKQMGYTKALKDGLSFPDDVFKPDVERVEKIAADLYLAKIETDDMINDKHPYFVIESFLPEQKKMEKSEITQPFKSKPKNVHTGRETPTSENSDSEYEDAKEGLSNEEDTVPQNISLAALKKSQKAPATLCYICGTSAVVWHCSDCQQDYCGGCDPIFHKPQERQSHSRTRKRNEPSILSKTIKSRVENVVPLKPMPAPRLENDGITLRKPPIPKPRKRLPSKASIMSSSVNLETSSKSPTIVHSSNPEELQPYFYKRREIQSPTQFEKKIVKIKVPQQPTGQANERQILRPPMVSKYQPVREPFKIVLLPRDDNDYESLKNQDVHIYETLDNQTKEPPPPPLPPRCKTSEKSKVLFKDGATTCPHCYCLNTPDQLRCIACATPLHEQPSSEEIRKHEEQGVIYPPWQSVSQPKDETQTNTTPFPKPIENPLYSTHGTSPPTDKTGLKQSSVMNISSPDLTRKTTELQWQCEFCTILNPVDKKICQVCAKTKTNDAKMVQSDPTPQNNSKVIKPQTVSASYPSFASKMQEDLLMHYSAMSSQPSAVVQLQNYEQELLLQKPQEAKSGLVQPQLPQSFSSISSYPSVFSSSSESEIQESVKSPIEMSSVSNSDGQDFVKKMKLAESLGFSPEELNIAYHLSIEDPRGPIHWLQTEWFDRIHQVMCKFADISREKNIGNISPEEARQALIERTGEVEDAVELCVEERNKKLDEVMKSGFFPKTECISALDKHEGDVKKSIHELRIISFQPLLQRVRDSCLADDADVYNEWQQHRHAGRQISTSPSEELFEDLVSQKEFDKDRRIRVMLAEKKFCSWGRAETAIRLIDMDFHVSDSIEAAKAYGDLERSLQFLHRECILCTEEKSENRMVTMLNCQCRFCQECVGRHFTIVIQEQNIMRLLCPQCGQPSNLDDDVVATEYFNNLDIMMRGIINEQTHDMFQQKLRDRTLRKEPNFRWCSHCSSGFINEQPQVLKMTCPNCRKYTCFRCKKQWEDQHEGISCEQFTAWKEANDPEVQANGLAAHLKQNGIECPQCKFRYDLAKGGCMHFKCYQCSHEFCSGCYKPFKQGNNCTVSENCARSGLHAHHPRDCLFYLRDRDPEELKKLLDDNNVQYNTEPPGGQVAGAENEGYQEGEEEVQGAAAAADVGHCKVFEQRETANGLQDDECGREILPGFAGLCRDHFKEYLVERINASLIDPVEIFTIQYLEAVIKRNEKQSPARKHKEKDPTYRERLIQFVKAQIPLPKRTPRRRVLNEEEPIAENEIHLILDEEEHDGPRERNIILGDMIPLIDSDGEGNNGYDSDSQESVYSNDDDDDRLG